MLNICFVFLHLLHQTQIDMELLLFVNKLCLVSDCVVLLTVTFSLRAKYARSCFLTLTDNKSFISEICFQLKNLCLAKFKQKKKKNDPII